MMRRWRFLWLVCLLSVLLVNAAQATNYYIRTDGNDANAGTTNSAGGAWRTMGKASTTMTAGDTGWVQDGTYVEDEIAFQTHNGTLGNPITLKAQNPLLAIVSSTSTSHCSPAISLYADYVTIEDLRVTVDANAALCGPFSAANSGIELWDTHTGGVVRGVQVDYSAKRDVGIKTLQTNSVIENNTVHSLVESMRDAGTIIRNNVVYTDGSTDGKGIVLKGGTRNNQIYNNVVHTNKAGTLGITVGGCSGSAFLFDLVARIETYNAAVYNNVVINDTPANANIAIQFRGDSNSKVFNNVAVNFNNPIDFAVSGTSCANAPEPRNVNPTYANNIFIGNGSAMVDWHPAVATGAVTIDYNNFYNFSSGVPAQTHAITGNPNLVNNLTDWHPQPGSPVIGTGTMVTVPAYGGGTLTVNADKNGVLRLIGTAWDLGIYSVTSDHTAPSPPSGLRVQ